MKKGLIIGLAALMVLGMAVTVLGVTYHGAYDVDFGIVHELFTNTRAYSEWEFEGGFYGTVDLYTDGSAGEVFDTTLVMFSKSPARFEYWGEQTYTSGDSTKAHALARGDQMALMTMTYDGGDNDTEMRRWNKNNNPPMLAAAGNLYKVAYDIQAFLGSGPGAIPNAGFGVSLQGAGYGELTKTIWGASCVFESNDWNLDSVVVRWGEANAVGTGTYTESAYWTNSYVNNSTYVVTGSGYTVPGGFSFSGSVDVDLHINAK